MSTPKTLKRYVDRPNDLENLSGYLAGIENSEIALRVGQLAADFVHLEDAMSYVLALLLGDTEAETAGFILRAIKSPTGRVDVMRDLLEKSPSNAHLDKQVDEYIDRFRKVSSKRNKYIHGRWWTHTTNGSVRHAAENDDGFGFGRSTKVTVQELDQLRQELLDLKSAIVFDLIFGPNGTIERRRRSQARAN